MFKRYIESFSLHHFLYIFFEFETKLFFIFYMNIELKEIEKTIKMLSPSSPLIVAHLHFLFISWSRLMDLLSSSSSWMNEWPYKHPIGNDVNERKTFFLLSISFGLKNTHFNESSRSLYIHWYFHQKTRIDKQMNQRGSIEYLNFPKRWY